MWSFCFTSLVIATPRYCRETAQSVLEDNAWRSTRTSLIYKICDEQRQHKPQCLVWVKRIYLENILSWLQMSIAFMNQQIIFIGSCTWVRCKRFKYVLYCNFFTKHFHTLLHCSAMQPSSYTYLNNKVFTLHNKSCNIFLMSPLCFSLSLYTFHENIVPVA